MKRSILMVFLIGALLWARGDESNPLGVPVDTRWPGVTIQVPQIKRIPGDRLLVAVMLFATPKAPIATMLGFATPQPTHVPVPAHMPVQLGRVYLPPQPYSIAGATMTDEISQRTYSTLPPDPKGPLYRSSSVLTSLSPGRGCYLTIQFTSPPPPPPPAPGQPAPKQYVSFLIPQAVGPITHVMLPPPGPSAGAPDQ